ADPVEKKREPAALLPTPWGASRDSAPFLGAHRIRPAAEGADARLAIFDEQRSVALLKGLEMVVPAAPEASELPKVLGRDGSAVGCDAGDQNRLDRMGPEALLAKLFAQFVESRNQENLVGSHGHMGLHGPRRLVLRLDDPYSRRSPWLQMGMKTERL